MMPTDPGIHIALVGESGAGKSTTARILQEQGFRLVEITGRIRQEAKLKHANPTRAMVQQHASDMQNRFGNDYYARLALTDLKTSSDLVFDSVRNIEELDCLQQYAWQTQSRFKLLALELPSAARFTRVTERGRAGDPTDYALFLQNDQRAQSEQPDAFQNNAYLMGQADRTIYNSGGIAALRQSLDFWVSELRRL